VSFTQVIEELPRMTIAERQMLIRLALELDDLPLSAADEALAESRLAGHHADPASSVPLEEMKKRLRSGS
jgi:putative addiction module component (TIGR02574 family)